MRINISSSRAVRGDVAAQINNIEVMSQNTRGSAKKRGHQHHPRNEGSRRKALLEKDVPQQSSMTPLSEPKQNSSPSVIQSASISNINVKLNECDTTVVIDLTNSEDELDLKVASKETSPFSKNQQTKSKRTRISKLPKDDFEGTDMSTLYRPAAEGSSQSDEERDPELEELSKLRCTSECTEMIAEREDRRRRRCADYPGLAFSSIFSSDTLMKFSIIRNELHNIMKTQLKRVRSNPG